MILKTEYGYNDDDFVQEDEKVKELTVTITLCEYRSLIIERVKNEDRICDLENKLKKSEDQMKWMTEIFLSQNPELEEDIEKAVKNIFNKISGNVSDEKIDRQKGEIKRNDKGRKEGVAESVHGCGGQD